LILRSARSGGDIGRLEAIGARNFLDFDDIAVTEEGEPVDAQSIISLPLTNQRCVLPKFERSPDDPSLRRIDASGKKWVIVSDPDGEPVFVMDSDHFLRDTLFDRLQSDPTAYWHWPIVVRDMRTKLGEMIGRMKVAAQRPGDDVIDHDLILVWGAQRRIITGADLLGRLMRDIVALEGDETASPSKQV
jgi:metal transporter CNNM